VTTTPSAATRHAASGFCAIDFGTSNSALAYPDGHSFRLAALEGGETGMPTAVFVGADDPHARHYGRAAIAAYVDGLDGRLMRSIKSILGSDLMDEATEVAAGFSIRYIDVVVAYLRHLRRTGERESGRRFERVVLGRPVFFDDDDPVRDARAQQTLATAARAAGFDEVAFQFEPIAAAFDFESRATHECVVLVADIGGGTSDFSVVRVGPQRRARPDRRADILANHGVHIAGTDFDRALNLATIQPALGLGSCGPQGRPVPSRIYFDLATWHLINTTYTPLRRAELKRMRPMYDDARAHARLLAVLMHRLGHDLAARAEDAKIRVSTSGAATIDLGTIEPGLTSELDRARQARFLDADLQRIVDGAAEAVRNAGLPPAAIDAVYFTGGSTGLDALTDRIAALFPGAQNVRGDRFASVVSGLAICARQLFGDRAVATSRGH
jgi:hypothetical chaperone protein